MNKLVVFGFLLAATAMEASGDAVIRVALGDNAFASRIGLFTIGAALLFGYGVCLNLAPAQFEKVVGLYIATLFVVWQIVNFIAFRRLPTLPIAIGGGLIVLGGCLVTFWEA